MQPSDPKITTNWHVFAPSHPKGTSIFTNFYLVTTRWPLTVKNCISLTYQVTSPCQKLSPSEPQVASNCNKFYFSDLIDDLSLSQIVTQWHPKWTITVTKCHPLTPKWAFIVTNCISVTSQLPSYCHKLSPSDPKGTTNCLKISYSDQQLTLNLHQLWLSELQS